MPPSSSHLSRSQFLKAAGAATVAGLTLSPAPARSAAADAQAALSRFLDTMPGVTGAYFVSEDGAFTYEREADRPFLCGSAFKVFVATEIHRMIEAGETSLDEMLPLDDSVYVPSSLAFTPELHGKVAVRVALQEMIAYSDNTATDMLMKRAGVARIRAFIAAAGLKTVKIPDSTRMLFSYIGGLPAGQAGTYAQMSGAEPLPSGLTERSADNQVQTTKASPRELATYYRRVLKGEFFKTPETLSAFRVTMSGGAQLAENVLPRGSSAYMKGGSIESLANAICVAGAMLTRDKVVYFMFATNWTATDDKRPYKEIEALLAAGVIPAMTAVRDA